MVVVVLLWWSCSCSATLLERALQRIFSHFFSFTNEVTSSQRGELTRSYFVRSSMSPRVQAKVLYTATGVAVSFTMYFHIPIDIFIWKENVLEMSRCCHWVMQVSIWGVSLRAHASLELVLYLYGTMDLFLNRSTPSNLNRAFSLDCLYLYPLSAFLPTCVLDLFIIQIVIIA